jgi:hypothetical protein
MFIEQAMESIGVDTLIVLEAEGPVGRAMVEMAIHSHLPVVAVSLDPSALRLLKLDNPRADLDVLIGSVVDVRSAVWLADDLRHLKRRYSGVIAPIESPATHAEDKPARGDALDVLRTQIRIPLRS